MSDAVKKQGRWIKNVKTGALFGFHAEQVKKPNMVECDADGNLLIENVSVASGDMVKVMEDLVEDKRKLKDRCVVLEKKLIKYEATFGALDSALPEAKGVAKPVNPPKDVSFPEVKKEPAPEELETPTAVPTKKEMAETLKVVYGIEADPKKLKVDDLQDMLSKAAVMTPEQLEASAK